MTSLFFPIHISPNIVCNINCDKIVPQNVKKIPKEAEYGPKSVGSLIFLSRSIEFRVLFGQTNAVYDQCWLGQLQHQSRSLLSSSLTLFRFVNTQCLRCVFPITWWFRKYFKFKYPRPHKRPFAASAITKPHQLWISTTTRVFAKRKFPFMASFKICFKIGG